MIRRKYIVHVALAMTAAAICVGIGYYLVSEQRAKRVAAQADADEHTEESAPDANVPARVGPEARKNLGLVSKSIALTTYHRKIEIPGIVTHRPGVSDRGVVAPVTGIVTRIHAYPGNYVEPDSPLFTLRLVSESLHTSQLELFKATKEIEIARQQKQRLEGLAATGGLAGSRIIEIDNQIQRMDVNVQAYRQALLAKGLPADRIEAAAQGQFVTEILVRAPGEQAAQKAAPSAASAVAVSTLEKSSELPFNFEFQSLEVELGQQVEAGELLCILADYRSLLLEGRGFKSDLPLIQEAARERYAIEIALEGAESDSWNSAPSNLQIQHVANQIDPVSRTFGFFIPLANQWQTYTRDGHERVNWRFRPGDRVRLSVGVEEFNEVFVLPQAAIVREGPEAFVFRQNGDLFSRIPVHVLHEDSSRVVVANDGKLRKGFYLAQNAAASLNRVLKAQLASGQPMNMHVHADGTVHAAH
jgi:cobalt-zinc-cadmium efflux system membrane fusion protein